MYLWNCNKKLDEIALKFDGKNQELLSEFERQQALYNKKFETSNH